MDIEKAARDYCALVERAESYERAAFVAAAVQRLAAVIFAAAHMPRVAIEDAALDADLPEISLQQWSERLRGIQAAIGDWDMYWSAQPALIDESDRKPELTAGSLSDDLADIWRDLAAGIRWIDGGGDPINAHWEWRFGFHGHWGVHATDSLRVLRACAARDNEP